MVHSQENRKLGLSIWDKEILSVKKERKKERKKEQKKERKKERSFK